MGDGRGDRIGHEVLGVGEDIDSEVSGLKAGHLVVAPFVWADNTCDFCVEGLHTSCRHGGFWGASGVDGGQEETVRVPQAHGTLVKLPVGEDSSLLTLSEVFPTGHHCTVRAGVGPRTTVTVIGDGAAGLSAVLAARRLGAERILLMGKHTTAPTSAASSAPPTSSRSAARRALPWGSTSSCATSPSPEAWAPARAYIDELLPDVLDDKIEPSKVFDRAIGLDEVPDGYRSMADRKARKVLIRP